MPTCPIVSTWALPDLRPRAPRAEGAEPGRKLRPGSRVTPTMAAPARLLASLRARPAGRPLHEWAPPRDVLLFEHERSRFFVVLGMFCSGQGVFWGSLAWAAAAGPTGAAGRGAAESGRGRQDLGSALRRYGLAVGCGAVGKRVARPRAGGGTGGAASYPPSAAGWGCSKPSPFPAAHRPLVPQVPWWWARGSSSPCARCAPCGCWPAGRR